MTKQPNPVDKHLGTRIRMRRLQLGISQEKLGEALGITFQQVQKYEKGTNRIGGSRMAEIAGHLEVDVGFFYEGAPDLKMHPAGTGAVCSPMDDFMASSDGLVIAQAFVRIPNPEIRRAIAGFVRRMGDAHASKPVTLMAAE